MNSVPHVVDLGNIRDPAHWMTQERASIDEKLLRHGAVLLRGLQDVGEEHFQDIVQAMCGGALEYVYRSTPRTAVGKNVYTATEYPPGLTIPFHCENAFQREWPMLLMFFCMQPAENGGGQTPLADMARVTARISPATIHKFVSRKVMYIRNYRSDIDIPWQTVFQTNDRNEVEVYCREHDIQLEWTADGLRTRQVCQATARHPLTGALVWFNQAHLFHPSALNAVTRKVMAEMYSDMDLPRSATFGDGSPLDEGELQEIREAFDAEAAQFTWQRGDILLLDNMQVAHGRTPFKGRRRVLAAMGRPYSGDDASPVPDRLTATPAVDAPSHP